MTRSTITWQGPRALLAVLLTLLLAASAGVVWGDDTGVVWGDEALGVVWDDASATSMPDGTLIVGLSPGSAAADVTAGRIVAELPALGMALVHGDAVALQQDPAVAFVSTDASLVPSGDDDEADAARPDRSAATEVDAQALWDRGFRGAGQTIALIDTGVSTHPDLDGRVIHGPNFAGDGSSADRYGHGTVMAGLIAGDGTASAGRWMGVAPEARVLSVKVAGQDGAADVTQVLAALQWLVSCHVSNAQGACSTTHDAGVLVLAYATDGTQSAKTDPIAYALQRVHDAGIVVVASAGNDGAERKSVVDGPGAAPAAFTVGAYDAGHDAMASFSEYGKTVDGIKKPEALASGVDLVTTVDPSSTIAESAPHALRDGNYIRGSGTSQAAAVAAGLAALTRQANPTADASLVRGILAGATVDVEGSRSGRLTASALPAGHTVKPMPPAIRGKGTGSLDGARGSLRVLAVVDGRKVLVEGDYTATGARWDGTTWTGTTWTGTNWDGTTWTGTTWTGTTFDGANWDGTNWDGSNWDGSNWDGANWDGSNWDSAGWR